MKSRDLIRALGNQRFPGRPFADKHKRAGADIIIPEDKIRQLPDGLYFQQICRYDNYLEMVANNGAVQPDGELAENFQNGIAASGDIEEGHLGVVLLLFLVLVSDGFGGDHLNGRHYLILLGIGCPFGLELLLGGSRLSAVQRQSRIKRQILDFPAAPAARQQHRKR
ncbi:hypothetical protein D3C76_1287520 [compost metagenome]